jgi:hypothetical protein
VEDWITVQSWSFCGSNQIFKKYLGPFAAAIRFLKNILVLLQQKTDFRKNILVLWLQQSER